MSSGLREAAAALIQDAPEPTVLAILKLLIAAIESPPARSLHPVTLPAPRAAPPPRKTAATAAAPIDENWERLRRQVRVTMKERGLGFAGVGQAIERSGVAVRVDLTSRKPPRPAVIAKLQGWLEQAPEVAVQAATFPGNGASRVHAEPDFDTVGTAD
jgi:hypothetical protein